MMTDKEIEEKIQDTKLRCNNPDLWLYYYNLYNIIREIKLWVQAREKE